MSTEFGDQDLNNADENEEVDLKKKDSKDE